MIRPTILASIGHFLPGFRSGGPVRSIANMISHLGPCYRFRLFTSDRDLGDNKPYDGIPTDRWIERDNVEICYLSPARRTLGGITALLRETPHDLLYLNSFFSTYSAIYPLAARRFLHRSRAPIILAPRGEFSPGALAIKPFKKRLYLNFGHRMGMFDHVVWQASTDREAQDIARTIRPSVNRVHVASDLGPVAMSLRETPQPVSPLKVLFLSRISPMKNLEFALDVLAKVNAPVVFSIYGPVEDAAYWASCQRRIANLPSHIIVEIHGEAAPHEVAGIMARQHLFFLPTRGENYGHVIAEALAAATPVLIADTTPWQGLADAGAGHAIALDQPDAFVRVIEEMAGWTTAQHSIARQDVWTFAQHKLDTSSDIAANRAMFDHVLNLA